MVNRVRVGIIGAGWIVQRAHIPSLLEIKHIDLKAIYDTDCDIARNVCMQFGIPNAYENLESFYESGLDAVIIATPNFTHAEYTIKALRAGINVLCEKPVALTSKEINQVFQTAHDNKVIFMPGYVNRWRTDIQSMVKLIQEGKIGRIKEIDAGWLRNCGVPRPGTWFTNKELSGGGVLVDLGSHVIDICQMIIKDKDPISYKLRAESCGSCNDIQENKAQWFTRNVETSLKIDVEQTAFAQIDFTKDVKLNIRLSWNAPIKGDSTYFTIHGDCGTISLRTLFGFSQEYLFDEDCMEVYSDAIYEKYVFDRKKNSSERAFRKMHSYFIDCVRGVYTKRIDVHDVYRTVQIIESLYENEKNEPIDWIKEKNG